MAVKTSWAAGDVLTAADLTDTFAAKADYPSGGSDGDLLIKSGTTTIWGSATAIGARVTNGSAQSLTSGTPTAVNMTGESFDTSAFHDNSTNNTRCTVPTGLGGIYVVSAGLGFASNATGVREAYITVNGASTVLADANQTSVSGLQTWISCSAITRLAAGDYIQVFAYQNSGGALNVVAGSHLALTRIGA